MIGDDALKLAVAHNRQFQFRKEALYLAALTLTGERHEFAKRPLASLGTGLARERDGDGRVDGSANLAVSQLLQSGGTVSATNVTVGNSLSHANRVTVDGGSLFATNASGTGLHDKVKTTLDPLIRQNYNNRFSAAVGYLTTTEATQVKLAP